MIDKMIAFGSGFDYITPTLSLLFSRGYENVTCHADWQPVIFQARIDRSWRIRNEMLVGDQYCFDIHKADAPAFLRAMEPYGWEGTP